MPTAKFGHPGRPETILRTELQNVCPLKNTTMGGDETSYPPPEAVPIVTGGDIVTEVDRMIPVRAREILDFL